VRECGLLQRGREAVYLRRRSGFIRLALAARAPVVPVFCFGQTAAYSFALAGPPLVPRALAARAARALRFWPMLMWGVGGTPLPHRVKLTVVVGRPIEAAPEGLMMGGGGDAPPPPSPRRGEARQRRGGEPPSSPVRGPAFPPRAAVAAVHAEYLAAVERLYAAYAPGCGQGETPLVVM